MLVRLGIVGSLWTLFHVYVGAHVLGPAPIVGLTRMIAWAGVILVAWLPLVALFAARRDRAAWHTRCPFTSRRAVFHEWRDRISHTRIARPQTRAGGNVMSLVNQLRLFVKDDSGQDLLEYALLVALIALVAFGAVQVAGTQVSTIFTSITNQLKNA